MNDETLKVMNSVHHGQKEILKHFIHLRVRLDLRCVLAAGQLAGC